MGTKLRLLVTKECIRKCQGCCNKQYDLDALDVVESFEGYDLIMLTGGEPLLFPYRLLNLIDGIKSVTDTPVILYTAYFPKDKIMFSEILRMIDGMTFTIHDRIGLQSFQRFNLWFKEGSNHTLRNIFFQGIPKSMRCNVFSNITLPYSPYSRPGWWEVKDGIEWLDPCPLLKDEVFMRMPEFFTGSNEIDKLDASTIALYEQGV